MTVKAFNCLPGKWALYRKINPGGRMMGEAVFSHDGDRKLNYHESSILTLDNGKKFQARKHYDYLLNNEGFIEVYFADGMTKGALFQTLVCNNGRIAEAEHFCAPDKYSSYYNFRRAPKKIEINHTVSGPKKDYQSKTILTREHA